MLAVAVGRRVLLLLEEPKAESEMGFEFTHIRVSKYSLGHQYELMNP